MKNKLIINIVLVYFVLLAVVLIVQMKLSSNSDISVSYTHLDVYKRQV